MTMPLDDAPATGAANSPMLAGLLQNLQTRQAARSTGPKTLRGKQASRANATTHGMRCQGVLAPDDRPKIEARAHAWIADLKPRGEAQTWLVVRAATISVRLDRCTEREAIALAENTAAVEHAWFKTRRAWARRLGNRLAENPKTHLARLLTSALGIDWLIARWEELGADLEDDMGYWSQEERERAVRLLGLPLRDTGPDHPTLRPLWVNALATDHDVSAEELDWTFHTDTSHLEGAERLAEARKPLPDEPTARRNLLAIVRKEQQALRTLRAEVWESVDRPALEAACRRARTFDPSPEATLASRYERSNASELSRCLNLLARLKREASRSEPSPSSFEPGPAPTGCSDPFADLPSAPPVLDRRDAPPASGVPNELQNGQDCDLNNYDIAFCDTDSEAPRASQGRPEVVPQASDSRPEFAPRESAARPEVAPQGSAVCPQGVVRTSRAQRRRALKEALRRRRGR